MPDLRPKWAVILAELIETVERELNESEKGTTPIAPNKAMPSTHPKKERGNKHYD